MFEPPSLDALKNVFMSGYSRWVEESTGDLFGEKRWSYRNADEEELQCSGDSRNRGYGYFSPQFLGRHRHYSSRHLITSSPLSSAQPLLSHEIMSKLFTESRRNKLTKSTIQSITTKQNERNT
jgi:hypothetical protein